MIRDVVDELVDDDYRTLIVVAPCLKEMRIVETCNVFDAVCVEEERVQGDSVS